MSPSQILSRIKQERYIQALSQGKRPDERDLHDYREIQIEQGIIGTAEGSSRVRLGRTDVLVGIKAELGSPFPDKPNSGVLTVNAELVPLASPEFHPEPPNETSIELARITDRGIREAKAIDLEKLCLVPGKRVYVIFVDIYVLNHDGNLTDASSIAALQALLNTKYPEFDMKNDEILKTVKYTQLPIVNNPIAVTFAKIKDKFLVDPSLEEEQMMNLRLTITTEKNGAICAVQKSGDGYISEQQFLDCLSVAQKKSDEIRKIMVNK